MTRSVDPRDYQDLPQRLAVMSKHFPDGDVIPPHHHRRDQLIYAVSGVMRISTAEDAWIVPPDRALMMPAGVVHGIEVRGAVEMRTLYIAPTEPAETRVLLVTPLLRALIAALAEEPIDHSGNRRAAQISDLIGTELARAEGLPLNIPLPRDRRLQRLCEGLMRDPSISLSLDQLSGDTGASAKTLERLCAKELGMSFAAWRRRVRFSKAIELLDRNLPVKQVARSCGYESASAFTYAFRREFGRSPTAFARS